MLGGRKKGPALDVETQLQTVPCRNIHVRTWQKDDDPETLVVEVKLKPSGLLALAMKALRSKGIKKYGLVGLSRRMYEEVDGKNTVEDLLNGMMANHKLTFLEARALTLQYLSDLMARGLVVILPPGRSSGTSPNNPAT